MGVGLIGYVVGLIVGGFCGFLVGRHIRPGARGASDVLYAQVAVLRAALEVVLRESNSDLLEGTTRAGLAATADRELELEHDYSDRAELRRLVAEHERLRERLLAANKFTIYAKRVSRL